MKKFFFIFFALISSSNILYASGLFESDEIKNDQKLKLVKMDNHLEGFSKEKKIDKIAKTKSINSGKGTFFSASYGKYIRGNWNPIKHLDCSAIFGCFESLEDNVLSISVIKTLYRRNFFRLDIDYLGTFGNRSTNKNQHSAKIDFESGNQFTLGILPTLRINKLHKKVPIGLGFGVGPSYTLGNRVVDSPESFSRLLSTVSTEISFPLDSKNNKSLVLTTMHECTFLGLLRNDQDRGFTQNWYTLGLRIKI